MREAFLGSVRPDLPRVHGIFIRATNPTESFIGGATSIASEADVHRTCLALLETIEKSYERRPGFRVKGKFFARLRGNPDALVAWRSDVAEKEVMIAFEPEKFFQTPHYEGHPAVLVRLGAVDVDELTALLTESWALRAPRHLSRRSKPAGPELRQARV